MKFKRNWRNPDWIVKSMIYSSISREELKALKNYWFYRWNFLEDSVKNKNAYDKLVQTWGFRKCKKRQLQLEWTTEAPTVQTCSGDDAVDELTALLADEINKEVSEAITKQFNEPCMARCQNRN